MKRLKDIWLLMACGVALLCGAGAVGAYSLYNYGVSRIPASRASAFLNLIPVFAIALGVLLLDERLNLQQGLACLAVIGGVLLTRRDSRADKRDSCP